MSLIPAIISILFAASYFIYTIPRLNSYPTTVKNKIFDTWAANFSIEVLNRIIAFALVQMASTQINEHIFKVRQVVNTETVLTSLACVLLLDFIFYWRHRFYHRFLMSIHRLHHQPLQFDFTLSFRVHPIEMVIQLFIFLSAIWIFKLDYWQMTCINVIFTSQALLSHFEFNLFPRRLKNFLNSFLVTSEFHQLHHQNSVQQHFGFLFNFWDRIFLTCNKKEF